MHQPCQVIHYSQPSQRIQYCFGRERMNIEGYLFFYCNLKKINPFNSFMTEVPKRMCPFCKDQSIDLFCRSVNVFLLNGNIALKRYINSAKIYLFKVSNRNTRN